MTETGTVTAVNKKNIATVRFERKDACSKCRMCAAKRNEMYVKCNVRNTLNAKVGDTVSVEMSNRAVLTAAFVVYVIPLILMLIGLLCSQKLSDGVQIGITMGCLAAGFIIAIIVDRCVRKKKSFTPTMTQIVLVDSEKIEKSIQD